MYLLINLSGCHGGEVAPIFARFLLKFALFRLSLGGSGLIHVAGTTQPNQGYCLTS